VNYRDWGTMNIQCICLRLAKLIIDEIDAVRAKHHGFSDEELDVIVNYDIKFRLGRDAGEEE
jgi:hypothetical protein